MKKLVLIFILLVSCTSTSSSEMTTAPIMELTYQNLDGTISIPKPLQRYMNTNIICND